jgi:hypothetical protein
MKIFSRVASNCWFTLKINEEKRGLLQGGSKLKEKGCQNLTIYKKNQTVSNKLIFGLKIKKVQIFLWKLLDDFCSWFQNLISPRPFSHIFTKIRIFQIMAPQNVKK